MRARARARARGARALQRGAVGPVQVVEHDHQRRLAPRPCAGTPDIASKSRNWPSSESASGGSGRFGKSVAQRGEDALQLHGVRLVLLAAHLVVGRLLAVGARDLHPRPVRRRARGLVGAAPQHLRPAHARVRLELLRRARLADAGLAHEHHDASRARPAPRRTHRAAARARARARRRRRARGGRAGSPASRSARPSCASGSTRSSAATTSAALAGRSAGHLREQLQDQRLEVGRAVLRVPRRRDRRRVDVLRDHRRRRVALERRLAR